MATTVSNPNKFKFLDYVGLQELVNKIKTLIESSKAATSIEKVEYDAATRKFTLTQGSTLITSDAITEVSAGNSGLMTPTQLETLNNVNANKVQRICVSVDGSNVADTLRYDNSTTNDKLAIIDYTTQLGSLNDTTKKQAPTAEAVKNALDTKVDNETYTADKATFALEASVQERFNNLTDTYYTEEEIDAKVAAINKTIADGDDLKVNVTDFNNYKATQDANNETQGAAIIDLQDFVGVVGKTSTNVYNKSEVDAAIDNAKKDILLGDATGDIAEAYDTIKEIADWITSDTSGATGLAIQVADLKGTVGDANTGLVKDVADLKAADEGLDARLDIIEGTGEGSIKHAIATTEGKAVGSLGEITLTADGKNYEMAVKSVSGVTLQTVVFETFTTADIEALFA